MQSKFSKLLLAWYDDHARALPWRVSPEDGKHGVLPDPYHVWLSEIMLQQTQVATVRNYFLNFKSIWPNIHDLAKAQQDDVMKQWAGLGYYSRARNLKKCADEIVDTHKGKFPENKQELMKLPGIGEYTSSAIAAIAFNLPETVVDGNVERVFARIFCVDTPLPAAKTPIKSLVEKHMCTQRPGDFAQACMDLGATICTPKNPSCLTCPLSLCCQSRINGSQSRYPIKTPRKAKPTRRGAAYVLKNTSDEIYLVKRPDSGLLGGMTGVPTTQWSATLDGNTGTHEAPITANWQKQGEISHTFTHFHLVLEVWLATSDQIPTLNGWWSAHQSLASEALPKVFRKVLDAANADASK